MKNQAKQNRLSKGLKNLSEWAANRANGEHDPETTLSILSQKVDELLVKVHSQPRHVLKCLPQFFEAVFSGEKTFEIRLNDRDFQVGDLVELIEWDNVYGAKRKLELEITYVLREDEVSAWHCLQPGWCVFAFKILK